MANKAPGRPRKHPPRVKRPHVGRPLGSKGPPLRNDPDRFAMFFARAIMLGARMSEQQAFRFGTMLTRGAHKPREARPDHLASFVGEIISAELPVTIDVDGRASTLRKKAHRLSDAEAVWLTMMAFALALVLFGKRSDVVQLGRDFLEMNDPEFFRYFFPRDRRA